MTIDRPSSQIDALRPGLFTYVILAPLVSALFAERIDNVLVACLLFVCGVGAAFLWVRRRIDTLEKAVRDQEERLEYLERLADYRPDEAEENEAPG